MHLEIRRQRLANVLRAGKELGISVLNTFTGDAETPEEIAAFIAKVRAIAEEAKGAGFRLCIETYSNLLPTAEIGREILAQIDNSWGGINYDPSKIIYYTEAISEEDIILALPHLGYVHQKDTRGVRGVGTSHPSATRRDRYSTHPAYARRRRLCGACLDEIECADYNWQSFEECISKARRSQAYWDGLGI